MGQSQPGSLLKMGEFSIAPGLISSELCLLGLFPGPLCLPLETMSGVEVPALILAYPCSHLVLQNFSELRCLKASENNSRRETQEDFQVALAVAHAGNGVS